MRPRSQSASIIRTWVRAPVAARTANPPSSTTDRVRTAGQGEGGRQEDVRLHGFRREGKSQDLGIRRRQDQEAGQRSRRRLPLRHQRPDCRHSRPPPAEKKRRRRRRRRTTTAPAIFRHAIPTVLSVTALSPSPKGSDGQRQRQEEKEPVTRRLAAARTMTPTLASGFFVSTVVSTQIELPGRFPFSWAPAFPSK